MASDPSRLDAELSGLDALELAAPSPRRRLRAAWAALWPKLAAIGLALLAWQAVVWAHWRPQSVLPGPGPVLGRLRDDLLGGELAGAVAVTMRRALVGYGFALLIGASVGLAVARAKLLRAAVGSLITGFQTMPSIAWFPLAILLLGLGEGAIMFVVVLGAAPAIANGVVSGVDHIPPILLRAGRVLGARGFAAYRHVVVPAALPSFVGGLKQGWAFAWRSLMAGELLAVVGGASLGVRLQAARQSSDAEGLMAAMIVILFIGIVVDTLVFGRISGAVRRRWGLIDDAAA